MKDETEGEDTFDIHATGTSNKSRSINARNEALDVAITAGKFVPNVVNRHLLLIVYKVFLAAHLVLWPCVVLRLT